MRIIAGLLKGRMIESPKGHRTHPMSDKIRGALFNALGDIDGLTFLDAFAGSGAISFEAISRGARHSVAVDNDRNAQSAILRNIIDLKLTRSVRLIRANVGSWSDNNVEDLFDIVVCDPPYDDVKPELIDRLSEHVRVNGLLVVSLPPNIILEPDSVFEKLSYKEYGDATLVFYKRTR